MSLLNLKFRKVLSALIVSVVSFSLIFPANLTYAKDLIDLPNPEEISLLSEPFVPTLVKGVRVDTENPFKFNFIIDTGDTNITGDALKSESTRLIKYFLASLTTPADQAWVNLSPYEKDRIISEGFGKTTMGRDLLAQDYVLKQLSASISNPQSQLGQEFWTRVHQQAFEQFGTSDIPMNTFNKIWIVPEDALVYEKDNAAYVIKSHLKVYLEEDYIALQKSAGVKNFGIEEGANADVDVVSGVSSQMIKEILIPAIEKEVNEGQTFSNLRQIYNSVILATWYKDALRNSILSRSYVNKNKVSGVNVEDESVNQEIFEKYVSAFKKGVYNFIREEYDQAAQEIVNRKYFSGGTPGVIAADALEVTNDITRVQKEDPAMAIFKGNPSHQFDIEVNALALNETNKDLAQAVQAPFVQSSALDAEDFALSTQGVNVAIPEHFSYVLAKGHELSVDNIQVMRVNGKGGENALLNDPLAKYILESSSSAAIGSYYLRGLGKKTKKGLSIKNAGDANALRFIEEETVTFVKNNSRYAFVELASEGLRDGSVSTPVGRIQNASLPGGYVDTATFEYDENGKGFIKSFDKALYETTLQTLRDNGVQILYKVTDSLEKTEGLTLEEARNKPTDSYALNSVILDSGKGAFRLPIDDNFRTAGYSYNAPAKADIGPMDVPSVAIPKIAEAHGLVKGSQGYEDFMNNLTVVMLGPRGFELKDEDSSDSRHAHFLADAMRFALQYPGMKVAPVKDGDLMPRLMALSGPNEINDNRNIITLGRSGSAEAEAARAWAKTYKNAHMVSRRVSTKATANNVAYETADHYWDEEEDTNNKLGYSKYDLTKVTYDEEEDVETIVSMTSVTGATDHLGKNFRDTMKSVQHDSVANTITTSTLINDKNGNLFVAKVTYKPTKGKIATAVESILGFHEDSKAVVDELGINALNTDSATIEEGVQKGILTPEEKSMFTQIPSNEIPAALSQNFVRHGLTMEDMFVAEVDPDDGILKPTNYKTLFSNIPTLAGVSVSSLQALAGSAYSGTLKQLMGMVTKNAGGEYGSEINAAAIKVGRDSLDKIAEELDIVIIVGGNGSGYSEDIPVGLIINPAGTNGTYMYFGDSVEVTKGINGEIGRPGTSSMISLVPYNMRPSTDGYRTSLGIDKYNPNKPYPVIDPVITKENSLKKVIGQLADYLDIATEALISDLAAHYELAALDRVKNQEMFRQAKELGISTVMREDGDPIFFIRALQGLPSKNGKKVFAISTGGANEHIMAMIFASLYKKGYMSTTYTSRTSLKVGEQEAGEEGVEGNMNLARQFVEKDIERFVTIDKALNRVRTMFDIPRAWTTSPELQSKILVPDSLEIETLRKRNNQSALVFAYHTGANSLDWGNLDANIRPVTWLENEDGSGRVIVNGFFINNEGKVQFYKMSLTTPRVTDSRYSIIERNNLIPNRLIGEYEKTRKQFKDMLAKNVSEIAIIKMHALNIQDLLASEGGAASLLDDVKNAVEAAEKSIMLEAFVLEAFEAVDRYILGTPSVEMEDGTTYQIVQKAEDLAKATTISSYVQGLVEDALVNLKVTTQANETFLVSTIVSEVQDYDPNLEARIIQVTAEEILEKNRFVVKSGEGYRFVTTEDFDQDVAMASERNDLRQKVQNYIYLMDDRTQLDLEVMIAELYPDADLETAKELIAKVKSMMEKGEIKQYPPVFDTLRARLPFVLAQMREKAWGSDKPVYFDESSLPQRIFPNTTSRWELETYANVIVGYFNDDLYLLENGIRRVNAAFSFVSREEFDQYQALVRKVELRIKEEFPQILESLKANATRDTVIRIESIMDTGFGDAQSVEMKLLQTKLRDALMEEVFNPNGAIEIAEGGFKFRNVGGINLNPELINMQIKRDGNGIILPLEEQPFFNLEIEGLLPVIINVTPISIPQLLGLGTTQETEELASL